MPWLMRTLLTQRIEMRGFIVSLDYGHRFKEFITEMSAWVAQGLIKDREDFVDGLEQAPQALIGMLQGRNFGKVIVRVAES